jgi:hypothetical protein
LGALALLAPAAHAETMKPLFKGPVMVLGDGLDWGTGKDVNGHRLRPGDTVTTTVRVGNGIPGQAGYASGRIPKRPQFVAGEAKTLDFSGPGNSSDDGAVSVKLPFAFPFGGLRERTASISTNGWISFGSPAWDSWEKASDDDRGAAATVGDFERGIMPYWGDLGVSDHGAGGHRVRMISPADGRSVAFQWEVGQSGGGPSRSFQLVLFRDGRFRFDYPGVNRRGGNKALIGYSLGTGPSSFHPIGIDVRAALKRSILVTPRPVKSAKSLPAGRAVLDLPAGAVPNPPRECNFQRIDEELGPGEILPVPGPTICWIPALAAGAEAVRTVSFRAPGVKGVAKKGVSTPAALRYAGVYAEGPSVLAADLDEVSLSAHHHHHPRQEASLTVLPTSFENSPPVVGQPWKFSVVVEESDEVGTLEGVKMTYSTPTSAPIELLELSGFGGCSQRFPPMPVSCEPPSGLFYAGNYIVVNPTEAAVGSPIPLSITATAPGAETVTMTYSSPPVVASS